ncbi:ferric reductase NAD binding domain-containing protein [Coniochaeta sp. 2T2.1]|nr:ferric reductase NAD binding domain-containing protein [Coniochaeta sp. 2T2.1]
MAWSGSANSSSSGAGGHGASGNSSGGGHGGGGMADAAKQAMFARRQRVAEQQMRYFAAGICGLIAIFVILHWTRALYSRITRSSSSTPLAAPFSAITRATRRLLIRKVPRFNSGGHALLVTAYVGINAAVCFTNADLKSLGNVAARFGWMTTGNMCVVVFLALKNTPLAFLTAYSYERLNCLHQISGCLTFVCMVVHAACYTAFFMGRHQRAIMVEKEQIFAIIAGFAFLSVTISALVIRRIWYELFYVVHICFFVVGIVCSCLHQPDFSKKIVIILILSAAMWFTDRVIRAARALYYMPNNYATVHPLPNGGTKIVMKKVPTRAEGGKHFFVWIPRIRAFEMHPFTVVGTQPLEFIVKSHDGFTRDLHKYAAAHPGATLRASVDGPYGTFPDPIHYDKIVLIAGGGGASFTFGLAVNALERMKEGSNTEIVFIWTVKQHDNLAWFTQHLETLRTANNPGIVNLNLYVTRAPVSPPDLIPHRHIDEQGTGHHGHDRTATMSSTSTSSAAHSPVSHTGTDVEKFPASEKPTVLPPITHPRTTLSSDIDRAMEQRVDAATAAAVSATAGTRTSVIVANPPEVEHKHQTDSDSERPRRQHRMTAGRPDVATLIREVVQGTPRNQRVLVASCGPQSLMTVVRDTTATLVRADGPAVELHCEQFGW